MTRTEMRDEIKEALKKGLVCTTCYVGTLIFAEPTKDGGYIEWFFDPYITYIDGGHWLEGFKCFEAVPKGYSYNQICYRLKIDNPIKHFLKDTIITSNCVLKEMLVKGKNLFNKKENNPITTFEWDEDDIF